MKYLNKIEPIAYQKFFLTGNPGQRIEMVLRYLPSQEKWMMDIDYLDFSLKGIMVTASPNILRAYYKIIPFGILCDCPDQIDPAFIDDFATQRCNLYLLNAEEVEDYETRIFMNE